MFRAQKVKFHLFLVTPFIEWHCSCDYFSLQSWEAVQEKSVTMEAQICLHDGHYRHVLKPIFIIWYYFVLSCPLVKTYWISWYREGKKNSNKCDEDKNVVKFCNTFIHIWRQIEGTHFEMFQQIRCDNVRRAHDNIVNVLQKKRRIKFRTFPQQESMFLISKFYLKKMKIWDKLENSLKNLMKWATENLFCSKAKK